jgi:hypothetical protein
MPTASNQMKDGLHKAVGYSQADGLHKAND